MVWYNNPILKAQLQSVLKKSNQRIVQLAATYGNKSYTFNQFTNLIEKGPLQSYVKERKTVKQKGVTIGNVKALDIRKVFRAVESGKMSRQELNQILGSFAGVHVDASGELVKNEMETGIKKVSEIRKETRERLIKNGYKLDSLTPDKINEETENYYEILTTFNSVYNDVMKDVGEAKMKKNEIVGQLWYDENSSRPEINYEKLKEIKKELEEMKKQAKKPVKIEEENS